MINERTDQQYPNQTVLVTLGPVQSLQKFKQMQPKKPLT